MQNEDSALGIAFARKVLQTFLVLILTQVFSLVISIITARTLGPDGKGAFTLVNLYPVLLFTFCHLSIYRILTVYVSEKKYPFGNLAGSVLFYIIAASTLMLAIFSAAFFRWNSLFIQGVGFNLIFLSALMLPFMFINQTFSSLLEASGKINQMNFKEISRNIVLFVAIVLTLGLFKKDVGGAVSAYFVTNLLIALLVIYLVKNISPDPWRVDFSLIKKIIQDGAKLHIAVLANFVSLRIDVLLLGHYRTTSSVGYYSVAVGIVELLVLASASIQTVFYSRIPDIYHDKPEMLRNTVKIYRHSIPVFLFSATLLGLCAKFIITVLYGSRFLPAITPLLILLPASVLLYLNNLLVTYLIATKQFLKISLILSSCSFLNIFCNLLLIPKYDMTGAAISSAISYSTQAVLVLWCFLSVTNYSAGEFFRRVRLRKDILETYRMLFRKIVLKSTQ